MAIQQYDYTACCTGFLQQLPSFWGISTGNRRSFCRSTGRKGHKKGWARRTSGGPWRPLCPRRRAWRAQYVRARRSESVLKTSSERKRNVTGEKGPFLPLLLSTLKRVAETRKTSRTKNALLPGSLDRFLREEQNWLSFQVSLREECEREPWMEVRVLPSCPFFFVRMALSIGSG